MDRKRALQIVKKHLPEHRYTHTIGVTDTAIALARRYGGDEEKAELAGIFHDYAKYREKKEMKDSLSMKTCPRTYFYIVVNFGMLLLEPI